MGNNNSNLQTAKNAKDDEFYTTYETVQKELSHYVKHFNKKQFYAIATTLSSQTSADILFGTLMYLVSSV